MFGASRPTFGNTGASPFGQQPTGTFGQPQATANAFGSTTNNAQSGFGGFGNSQQQATPSPFGMSQQQQSNAGPFDRATSTVSNPPSLFAGNVTGQTAAAGTAIKPFTAYTEKDATTGMNNVFQSISCMPEYKNHSFEELRFQDYQANNKFGQGGAAAGGNVASTFGSQANNSPFGTNNQSAFGVGNTNATSTGGLFGQTNNNTSNSPFGQGATNNSFGQPGTSPFGQSNTGTAFGQPSNSPFGQANAAANSPFGMNKTGGTTATGAGGLFGQNTTGTAFGQNTTTSGGLFGQANNSTTPFGQSNAFSRTNNTSAGGLFGQSNQPQQAGGIFGSTNSQQSSGLFGQTANTQQQQAGGLFGSNPTGTLGPTNNNGGLFGQNTGLFGQNNNTNAFGQSNNSAGGLFGQNTQNQQQGDIFGQQNNQQNGLFRPANQQDGGLFNQNNQQQSGGLFGQDNSNNSFRQTATTAGGGMFGSKPNTTGGLFGQSNVGNTFGQSNIGSNAPGGGLFGQNNQQQQGTTSGLFGQTTNQPQTGGLFGQNNNTTQTGNAGLFGQNNNSNQQNSGGFFGSKPNGINSSGGMFGNKTASTGGLFGNTNTQTQPGGGLFGQNNANSASNTLNSNQPSTLGGGLFGNKPANTTGSSLFGNNNNAQNNNTVTGGGLFGNNQTANTQLNTSSGGGLFGSKPGDSSTGTTTGGLFAPKQPDGSTAGTTTGGLFGAKPSDNSSTGLFGAKPSNTFSGGLFSNSVTQQNNSSTMNSLQQTGIGSSVAAVSQQGNNPYGTNDLFSRVIVPSSLTQPSKPSATKLNADNKKKASLTSAYRLAPKPLFSTRSKTTIPVLQTGGASSNRKSSFISSPQESVRDLVPVSTGSSSIFTNETDELILSSSNKLFNPDKKSFKNLILNRKKMEDSNADENADEEPRRITFTSGLSGEQEMSPTKEPNFLEIIQDTPVATKENLKVNGGLFAPATLASTPIKNSPEEKNESLLPFGIVGDDISFTEDGYYVSPSLETLSNMTLLQLRKVTGLAIGQKEYGKIDFLDPVDLSNISLPTLCGTLVRFSEKVCEVSYVGNELPKPGDQLNVKARITLYNTFPTDKATRQPIKDPKHPILKRHIERLKKIEHTKFESYDVKTGSYTFVVETPVA